MKAVDALRRFMERRQFSFCNGAVYKKIPEAKYTYVYFGSVHTFLMQSLGNKELANEIVTHVSTLSQLLSQPSCRLVEPMKIDYNIIEVLPSGTCFNIEMKSFSVDPPIFGSPRAFVRYTFDENKVPYPKIFVEGISTLPYLYV